MLYCCLCIYLQINQFIIIMIQLKIKDYSKVINPILKIEINSLFARAVINQKVKGQIYVDNAENPQTFYVIHPYGMSLLFGKSDNNEFNNQFRSYVFNSSGKRIKDEWMQAYPNEWGSTIKKLFGETEPIVEYHKRTHFKFNKDKFYQNKQIFQNDSEVDKIQIRETSSADFNEMRGTVIPSMFWNNSEDFITHSIGYSLFHENKLAAIAFGAYIEKNTLELGIETCEQYRGKHFAYKVCCALIDYCLENNYCPVWACRSGNVGSYQLAQKLGFEAIYENSYYHLKV